MANNPHQAGKGGPKKPWSRRLQLGERRAQHSASSNRPRDNWSSSRSRESTEQRLSLVQGTREQRGGLASRDAVAMVQDSARRPRTMKEDIIMVVKPVCGLAALHNIHVKLSRRQGRQFQQPFIQKACRRQGFGPRLPTRSILSFRRSADACSGTRSRSAAVSLSAAGPKKSPGSCFVGTEKRT